MRVGWLAAGVLALAGSLAAEDMGIVPNENLVVDGRSHRSTATISPRARSRG